MKKRPLLLILLVGISFAACRGEEAIEEATAVPTPTEPPSVPTQLPTAVPPESTEAGGWTITFGYDFPEAYWVTGNHSYGFKIFCPNLAYDYSGEWKIFKVTENANTQSSPIYLRLEGLSTEPFTPAYLPENRIHPDQTTAARVHLVGLSEGQVEQAREECEVLIAWDNYVPQILEIIDVFEQ